MLYVFIFGIFWILYWSTELWDLYYDCSINDFELNLLNLFKLDTDLTVGSKSYLWNLYKKYIAYKLRIIKKYNDKISKWIQTKWSIILDHSIVIVIILNNV